MAPIDVGLDDPWFGKVASGEKTIEGRLGTAKWRSIVVGDVWNIIGNDGRSVLARVTGIRPYKTFKEYLTQEGLAHTLPGVDTMVGGLAVYEQYYPRGRDEALGVLAFELALE